MCNVDTGVLGQRWVDKDKPYGFPDFQTTHTCKNYDDIRKWAEKLQVGFTTCGCGLCLYANVTCRRRRLRNCRQTTLQLPGQETFSMCHRELQ